MHELGVVFHMIDTIEQFAKANGVEKVSGVTVERGEVSMVLEDYMIDCWNWAVKRSAILDGAPLTVETIPAVTFCEDCKETYSTVKYAKICPYCHSEHTYLIQGNELSIKDISVYEDDMVQDVTHEEGTSDSSGKEALESGMTIE